MLASGSQHGDLNQKSLGSGIPILIKNIML